jgi:hypothetical protein
MWVFRKLGYSFGGLPPSLCYGSKELPSCPLQLGVALKRCNFTSIRPWTQVAKYSPHETHPQTSASADQTLVQGLTWWCAAAARRVPRRRVCRDEIAMFGCVGYESIRYRRIYKQIYIYVLYMYIYICIIYIYIIYIYTCLWQNTRTSLRPHRVDGQQAQLS